MKVLNKIFSICLLAGLLTAGVSFSDISVQNPHTAQHTLNVLNIADEDCYTYDEVFENGLWWIYVYDCDGNLVEVYIDPEV